MMATASRTAGGRRTGWNRLRAVVLAVLFLAGQYGPPLVDMLESHVAGTPQAHVEQSHDRSCHTERCMLGYAAPTAHLAVLTAPLARIATPRAVRGAAAPSFIAARWFSVVLPQPRAPPLRSA